MQEPQRAREVPESVGLAVCWKLLRRLFILHRPKWTSSRFLVIGLLDASGNEPSALPLPATSTPPPTPSQSRVLSRSLINLLWLTRSQQLQCRKTVSGSTLFLTRSPMVC